MERLTARRQLLYALVAGLVVAVAATSLVPVAYWLLIGWDAACLTYLVTVWWEIWPRTVDDTSRLADRVDPARAAADVLTLSAAVASLGAVSVVLLTADRASGAGEILRIVFALVSIVLSWAVVHTVFTLRYAHLYYRGVAGGIDFNGESPRYSDFAYLAFTIGMTFQVSDTTLRSGEIRRVALMHAMLSYMFGTGILAITINLVASLSSNLVAQR